MKEDWEKVRGTVRRLKDAYNFRGLFHFTDFSNLNSIISIGFLCSRFLCYANHIEFHDCSYEEIMNDVPSKVKGCTRFYYVEKNNYDAMLQLNIPVYLLFNEEILYLDLAVYTDGNADLGHINYGTDYEFFNYNIDWGVVFNKITAPKYELCVKRQAELLIDEPVPIKNLKNIIFRCNADYKHACNLFGKNKMFLVEPEMFFNNSNYIKDYNIVYNSTLDKSVFILHFSSNTPVKNNDRHEYKLYDMDNNLIRATKVNFLESESTDFNIEVADLPCIPIRFRFWFYGVLSIEEIIG